MTGDSRRQASWHAKAYSRRRQKFARNMQRAVFAIVLLTLIAFLLYLLFPPFFGGRTHLVLLGTGVNDAFHLPTIPFVQEDQEELEATAPALVHDFRDAWRSSEDLSAWSAGLREPGLQSSDTLLIYLTAHGVSQGGEPFLLFDDFSLRRPNTGRVSVEKLLRQLRSSPAEKKILFLNAGTIESDPRIGIFVNEFPRLLQAAVHAIQDPKLWVFCSHSTLQRTHVSHGIGRSVFGLFLAEGLRGAADLNRDRTINLRELAAFTEANVSHWVRRYSNREVDQTPVLLWGGGPLQSDGYPDVAVLPPDSEIHRFDIADYVQPARPRDFDWGAPSQNGRATGVLRRRYALLASNSSSIPSESGAEAGQRSGESGSSQEKPTAENPNPNGTESRTSEDDEPNPSDDVPTEEDAAGGESSASGASTTSNRARQLLASAWELRDRLAQAWSATNLAEAPIENVPHLWREFQSELLSFEKRLRAGSGIDPKPIEEILSRTLSDAAPAPAASGDSADPVAGKAPSDTRNLFVQPSVLPAADLSVHSVALAQLLTPQRLGQLGIDVVVLEELLKDDTREKFDKWLASNWRSELDGYIELHLWKKLSEASDLPWELARLAAETCLIGERVAAFDLLLPGWFRDQANRADQLRFFAEGLLFDQLGQDWAERSRRLLEEARSLYQSAEDGFDRLRRAEYLRDRLVMKLTSYVRLHRRCLSPSRGSSHPWISVRDLKSLTLTLSRLSSLLQEPATTDVSTLDEICDDLQSLENRLGLSVGDEAVLRFVEGEYSAGAGWSAELYLDTPLLSASSRQLVLGKIEPLFEEFVRGYVPATVELKSARAVAGGPRQPKREEWLALKNAAEVQFEVAELTQGVGHEADFQSVEEAMNEVKAAYHAAATSGFSPDANNGSSASVGRLWRAYERFGEALGNLYRNLGSRIDPQSSAVSSSLAAVRALRWLDPRDAWRFRDQDVMSLYAPAAVMRSFPWQAQRLSQAARFGRFSGSDLLSQAAQGYRETLLERGVAPTRSDNRFSIRVPSKLDLQDSSQQVLVVALENNGETAIACRVALSFDQECVQLEPVHDAPAIESEESPSDGQPSTQVPTLNTNLSQLSTYLSPVIQIPPDSILPARFRIIRGRLAALSSQLIVDAFDCTASNPPTAVQSDSSDRGPTFEGLADAAAETAKRYQPLLTRHRVELQFPVAELLVQSGDATWISSANLLDINLFPNRAETFRLGAIRRSPVGGSVSMSLYSLGDDESLNERDVSSGKIEASALARFNLNVSGEAVPAFPAASAESEAKSEAGSSDGEPGDASPNPDGDDVAVEPAEETEASLPALARLNRELLVVLTDTETGQTTLRRARFNVRRPRGFLVPSVRFNAATSQIEIEVAAPDPSVLPPGQPVQIACRLEETPLDGLQGKLRGVIAAPDFTARMFIELPSTPPQTVRLYIDVDNYPRAFVFDVPCGKHAEVPEKTDLRQIQIATRKPEKYLAGTDRIPVEVRINAPTGTFSTTAASNPGQQQVELDVRARDQRFGKSTRFKLFSDRRVELDVTKLLPDGTIQLRNRVTDWRLDLPTDGIENKFLDITAKLNVAGQSSSERIPLFIDTAPPAVGPLEPLEFPGFIGVGKQLAVRVWAWDTGSGVQTVEAAWGDTDSREFPSEGPSNQAIQVAPRQWSLSIPAAEPLGRRSLFVRAVDRAGNRSEPVTLSVEIVSAEEGEAKLQQQPVRITGLVTFRGQPVPETNIKLTEGGTSETNVPPNPTASDSAPLAVATADSRGRYTIEGITPGSYVLSGKTVMRNRVRRIEQDIVVEPGPSRTLQIDIELP